MDIQASLWVVVVGRAERSEPRQDSYPSGFGYAQPDLQRPSLPSGFQV